MTQIASNPTDATAAPLPEHTSAAIAGHGVVLFDGVCNFCNGYVNYVIDHDPADYFRFASLQSAAGSALAARHGIDVNELSTVVFIADDKAYTRSGAVLRICGKLRGPMRLLSPLLIVPAPLRDFGYRLVAKNRYRLFGKREACRLPTESDRARFLPDPVDAQG